MSDVRFVAIIAVVTAVLAAVGAWISPRPETGGGEGSSYSATSHGGKAAFHTLAALGYSIERSIEPLTAVRAEPSRTLLVITGRMPASDQDKRALKAFVSAGGAALLTGPQGAESLGLAAGSMRTEPFAKPTTHRVTAASPITRDVSEITMLAVSGTPPVPASYLSLVSLPSSEPLVATARIGDGRATWLAAVTPITNGSIRDADNLQLLLNIAGRPGDRRILWDEHYHGYSRSMWSYVAATPLPWAIAQCGLVALAVIATFSRRRTPVRSRTRDARSSPMEFVEMLRVLYARADGASSPVSLACSRFRARAVSRLGLPASISDDELARQVTTRCSATVDEVARLLSAGSSGRQIDASRALPIVARLQALSHELETARPAAAPPPQSRR